MQTFQDHNLLKTAVTEVAALSPLFDWVGIYLLKEGHLELGPYQGAPTEHTRIPIGKGICGRAVEENVDLNISDVTAESNYISCSIQTKSELVVLIRSKADEILGQIDIDSHTPGAFSKTLEAQVKQIAIRLGKQMTSAPLA